MIWPFNRFARMMLTIQHARSNQWPTVRKLWLKDHPTCAACGSIKSLQVHHKFPFHLDPSKELDPANFITLCERIFTDHHLEIGHLGNFKDYNPNVEGDAARNLARLQALKYPMLKSLHPGPYWIVQDGSIIVTQQFTVKYRDGREYTVKTTEETGRKYDGYTWIFQVPDELGSIVHDDIYRGHRTFDNGDPIDKPLADDFLEFLMESSWSLWTRLCARPFWAGVHLCGSAFWATIKAFKMIG